MIEYRRGERERRDRAQAKTGDMKTEHDAAMRIMKSATGQSAANKQLLWRRERQEETQLAQ